MKKLRFTTIILISAIMLSVNLYANQSNVEIAAPDNAVKGSEITIKINVTHSANNFMHHTQWAYIKVNGKEIGRWEYPFDTNDFSKEVKVKVAGPLEIEAMSNCNIHGSTGAKTKTVSVK
mgnify:CR=1 FL=1